MSASGLVNVTRIGNQKHFQANRTSPIFKELRRLVVKTVGLADPIRRALAPLSQRLKLAVLYGSVAKGTATAHSDIDLLIVSDELTLEDVYAALAAAEASLNRQIRPTLYTSKEYEQRRKAHTGFLTRILTGTHIVLFGKEHGAVPTG